MTKVECIRCDMCGTNFTESEVKDTDTPGEQIIYEGVIICITFSTATRRTFDLCGKCFSKLDLIVYMKAK